jgi:glycosyl transferase family 1
MIAWFATKGSGSNDALRMEMLLSRLDEKRGWEFDRRNKRRSFFRLLKQLRNEKPELLVMEGTGIAGGLLCMLGKLIWKVPYMFSSGDAVGPFVAAHKPWAGPFFAVYERLLCRLAAGFIGWTPYLCGRAMTLGCPRAVTAPGWPMGEETSSDLSSCRAHFRLEWGVPEDGLVVGLVGALEWNSHRNYCYGLELVRAVARLKRKDVVAVVVGGGSGLERLRAEAGELLGSRILLPGPVALEEVMSYLMAFDVASLPQSTDAVGAFRYTTKLSEYAAAHLPVITSRIPMAYDLGGGWMWRLPGEGPWEEVYVAALTALLESMDPTLLEERRQAVPDLLVAFEREAQVQRVTHFIQDYFEELSMDVGKGGLGSNTEQS